MESESMEFEGAAPDPADLAVAPQSSRADVWAAVAAIALFTVAVVVGAGLYVAGRPVRAGAAPLFAHWQPHIGPGTPLALAVAALVVWRGPVLATRLSWCRLLATGYATALAWTLSLALVDGWQRGMAGRLTTPPEYLSEVDGVTDLPAMLRGFASRILDFQPDSWATHVSGHPPGALMVFVLLDRVGLGGGGWAALICVLIGGSVAVTVPVTLRALGEEAAARAAVPLLALLPGAVWVGASADGLFAGVTAAGVAFLALGLTGRAPVALLGGLLLGVGCYLSYGLVLMAPIALAAVVCARRVRPLAWAGLGSGAVVVAFTLAGFRWWEGYDLVVQRYYQGIASDRPYAYWVWANLAAVVACAGPAVAAVLRRVTLAMIEYAGPLSWLATPRFRAAVLLPAAALAAIVAADLSGLSKAEVERIWLPFVIWFAVGATLLPVAHRRAWLAAQAGTALLVNHLLFTTW